MSSQLPQLTVSMAYRACIIWLLCASEVAGLPSVL